MYVKNNVSKIGINKLEIKKNRSVHWNKNRNWVWQVCWNKQLCIYELNIIIGDMFMYQYLIFKSLIFKRPHTYKAWNKH